jgi:hypothetical protein
MAFFNIDLEVKAAFLDLNHLRWSSNQNSSTEFQPLEVSDIHVRPLISISASCEIQNGLNKMASPVFCSSGKELEDQDIVISVHDQPR